MKGDHEKKPFVLYQGAIEKEIKFDKANLIIADSLFHGDLAHAKNIKNTPMELGAFLEKLQMRYSNWVTVADLTGIAIEDLQVTKVVFSKLFV